jgi:stage V sporulation protein SpoVS
MTSSESPVESSGPDAHKTAAHQPQGFSALAGVLAVAARALVEAPADSDDAALLAILGRALVPSLGDVVALYAADASGRFRLIGAAPDDAVPARRLLERAEQHSELVAEYAAIAAGGHSTIVQSSGETEGEVVAEVVAPLGSAAPRNGLLVIGSTSSERRYDDADRSAVEVLAAIVSVRRAASRQAVREAALRQRIEAMALAGRELAHLLNNDLTMPVGVVELLLDRNTSTPDLQEMLEAAAKDLAALEQHVRAFHDLMREHSSSLKT